jgi:hypothetical protein
MRLVIASDTHSLHDTVAVPDGDVFIHAGDLTNVGDLAEIREVGKCWHKIVIAGNHDFGFEREPPLAQKLIGADDGICYLQDSAIDIEGVRFWGSPFWPCLGGVGLRCTLSSYRWWRDDGHDERHSRLRRVVDLAVETNKTEVLL